MLARSVVIGRASASSARLSSFTFTLRLAEAEQRPARVVVDQGQDARERQAAPRATRLAWMRALAARDSGSTPEADVVAASAGILAAVSPGV